MGIFIQDCPHCPAAHAAFNVVFAQQQPNKPQYWNALCVCPACGESLALLVFAAQSGVNPQAAVGDISKHTHLRVLSMYPAPDTSPTPEHVPSAAGRAYEQGVRCLSRSDYTPAAAMFRRCLEIALKAHSPEIEAWKLEQRIDKLAAERKITPDMQTWAHRVRLDGNDALHEEEDFTKESATELMEFTRLLLTYMYTLPEKVKQRIEPSEPKP
ncbi:DUF4145 domain-containing protein [Paraburkholderia sp. C35]|uniref:DUF4145 domain-containing protein n=1 Tax=Paraburkholderia sp. C35 TaxID=2126993 RepID=UPI001EF49389|nr:DUF4145 domain-containing protein [Paraburkholderia sp. C35]